ncbi:MAG: CBS domain-containing protein [Pseudomonadota bacterium]
MVTSYRAPIRRDKARKAMHSQTTRTNMAQEAATVARLMENKGGGVVSIRPQETLGKAVEVLRDKGIGALIVTDANGGLCGILSERDVVRKLADTPGQTLPKRVEEIMTKAVEVCAPSDLLVDVLRRMSKGKFRHMPVADKTGLLGMVTIGDVVNYRLVELEHEALQLKQMIAG